ncbi:MAG: metal ABC transporter substrate-binding protein [Candidatus Eremiobacteraeota bacterium]|nr:metal ABC transporter substrate-binding protein [Candidatus Eremiobacteraeota bacterium]
MPQLFLKRACAWIALFSLCACSAPSLNRSDRIKVVTSISTFNSFVSAVGGSHVVVTSLVPIGASPETYQPTPENVATLARAQILVENGAGLESWLDRTVKNAGSSSLRIVTGTDGLKIINQNPHLWMDPQYAKNYVRKIRDALMRVDPSHAYEYRKNAGKYSRTLDALTRSIARRFADIPAQRRYMIVFHNAWQYYNDRFGITTLGFIEQNPGEDPNPQQIARLIDLAKLHRVRAIFSEPEYSPKLARQIAHDAGISIVDDLYDDSIGTGRYARDYISMLNYDTGVIVKSMQ